MKIDIALTSCNLNNHYVSLIPYVIKTWEKIGIKSIIILISDFIPNNLENFKENIILFNPIQGMNTAYISQVIRIIYPCLFDNKNIILTDIDIFPISYNYFHKSVENIEENKFVIYTNRYLKQKMIAICYCLANSNIWKEIFKINTNDDIILLLKKWYTNLYTGKKNCVGWYTDQIKLYEFVFEWNRLNSRLIILTDKNIKYKRLDKKYQKSIIRNLNDILQKINNNYYTDFHCIKPFSIYKNIIERIYNTIIKK